MIKFSIISTVYNQQEYIKDCIESVLAQTYTNFEHIIVDDGSIDNSYNVCMEYAKRDSRIRVIHKENGGVSSARNVGLDNVTGDYVFFLDGDDFFHPELLQKCFSKLLNNNIDVLEFGLYNCTSDGTIVNEESRLEKDILKSEYEHIDFLKECRNNDSLVATKCVSFNLLQKNKLRFNCATRYAEDELLLLKIISMAENFARISFSGYYYRKHNLSSTSGFTSAKQFKSLIIVASDFYNFITQKKCINLIESYSEIFWSIVDLRMIYGEMDLLWKPTKKRLNQIKTNKNNFVKKMYFDYRRNSKKPSKNETLEFRYLNKRDDALRQYIANQNRVVLNFRMFNLKLMMFFIKVKRKVKIVFGKG